MSTTPSGVLLGPSVLFGKSLLLQQLGKTLSQYFHRMTRFWSHALIWKLPQRITLDQP